MLSPLLTPAGGGGLHASALQLVSRQLPTLKRSQIWVKNMALPHGPRGLGSMKSLEASLFSFIGQGQ